MISRRHLIAALAAIPELPVHVFGQDAPEIKSHPAIHLQRERTGIVRQAGRANPERLPSLHPVRGRIIDNQPDSVGIKPLDAVGRQRG